LKGETKGSHDKSEIRNPKFEMKQAVSLSVVIPVFNGGGDFIKCLAAVRRSTFTDYELIVVDDGSTDDSRQVAVQYGARVLPLQGSKHGPGYTRNRGVEIAVARLILFLDADVCVHADTLEKAVQYFDAHPSVDAVIGSYDDKPAEEGFLSQYKNLFHHYIHQNAKRQASTFWGGCGAIKRAVFIEHGGFDESYGRPSIEDIELGFRLRSGGRIIHLVKEIQVTHLKRWTFRGLLRTDFLDRAIPWTLLMLRDRTLPADLNLRFSHQLSVVILYALLLISGITLVLGPHLSWLDGRAAGTVAVFLCGMVILLNRHLYLFFAQRRSWPFAIRALPMHWFYYLYSGAAVVVAVTLHIWNGRGSAYERG
jgi:GT2 family glycosyltransferase